MAQSSSSRQITRLLIANRGEIAVRIIKTCRRMGVSPIAVYSDADKGAYHCLLADEAIHIGPSEAALSYLSIENILHAAKLSRADAIHPGYGFLAENEHFARAVTKAGLKFVGPSSETLALLGDKRRARELAVSCNIPVIPGGEIPNGSTEKIFKLLQKVDLPIMLKAAAGGGGKGMRLLESWGDLEGHLKSARHEAKAFFHDDSLLFEHALLSPRHIEVQVIADTKGNTLHLFERDCSLQRRHQKVIEIAPAPNITRKLADALYTAALTIAKAAKLENAATVEFLVPGDADKNSPPFYFLEVNPRLQVEHPITEMITNLDLVELQLLVASGGTLPMSQKDIHNDGFAVEARLCGESPERNFAPSAGKVSDFLFPKDPIRTDHALSKGASFSTDYDSLIAKQIVHEPSYEQALTTLRNSLLHSYIQGFPTTIPFLHSLLTNPKVLSGNVSTTLISEHLNDHQNTPWPFTPEQVLAAHLFATHIQTTSRASNDLFQALPFFHAGGASLGLYSTLYSATEHYQVRNNHTQVEALLRVTIKSISKSPTQPYLSMMLFEINGSLLSASLSKTAQAKLLEIKVGEQTLLLSTQGFFPEQEPPPVIAITADGFSFSIQKMGHQNAQDPSSKHKKNSVLAPIPGKVLHIHVSPGEVVREGAVMFVLESMKTEHLIIAAGPASVATLEVTLGELVKENQLLATLQ